MDAVTEARLEQCIDKLYGAIAAPGTLLDAVRTVRLMVGASGATHLRFAPDGELSAFVDDGHDPECQRLYLEHYIALDPTRILVDMPAGDWLRDDRVLDPRCTKELEFVADFAPRAGMRWFLGCKLYEDNRGSAFFSLQRGMDHPPFDDSDFATVQQLQPHLKRIFRMLVDLAGEIPALASASTTEILRTPVCVVEGDCRLRYANRAAEDLLARDASVRLSHGHLWAPRPEVDALLRRAVALAHRPPRRASAFSPEPQASAVTRLQVRVVPLAPELARARYGRGDLVLVFLAAGAAPPNPEELQQLFGLTRAEAELAALLAQGVHLDLCAVRRGVSIATVRAQLQSVFSKTGAGSQAQLLSMVLALPPVM